MNGQLVSTAYSFVSGKHDVVNSLNDNKEVV